ncbi:MAG: heavy metal translocating P-type ATPase [Deltaproteobacteria bacterium]|nr:MAG: heavy metal translocating P-type ATPase [Deltaproteobacteria bacterium]
MPCSKDGVTVACSDTRREASGPWWRFPPLRNALLAGAIALPAYLLGRAGGLPERVETALYLLAMPIAAWRWIREGFEALLEAREIGIEILMLAAAVGSAVLGMWEEAAALCILYGLAEGIEEHTFARTRSAIRGLLDLAPKEARVLRDGVEVVVPATEVRPGDRFVVRPGEGVPTDGRIVEGESSLDESPVTGESVPVDRGPGDPVFAGSINGQGALLVEATASFEDNTLARIVQMVEEAQERKGRAQAWMERFGRRYSPAVLAAAVGMLLWPWISGGEVTVWAARAVTLLVAAAPCALVISLPIAMAAGISGAGRRGILIKGGVHLEHLGRIRIVAFDKTGTLTVGQPRVVDVVPLRGDLDETLAAAAALEHFSEHPLARAIVAYVSERGLDLPPAEDFQALTGAGARARIGGSVWRVGQVGLFVERGFDPDPIAERIEALEREGKTVVLVGDAEGPRALIALRDELRPESQRVVAALHRMGIRTVMLTGDQEATARALAAQAGIDEVHAGLRPEEKVAHVEALLEQGPTLMVGDGVNDAPALAAATCGVAMGAAGTDAAIEAADIALMADDLWKLEEALRLGRKARVVSLQNVVFGITVLLVLVPAGVLGAISIATAVVAHEGSELAAVANGLRAARP